MTCHDTLQLAFVDLNQPYLKTGHFGQDLHHRFEVSQKVIADIEIGQLDQKVQGFQVYHLILCSIENLQPF